MIPSDLNNEKRGLKSNNPKLKPGKFSVLTGGNFEMVIDK